MKKLIAIFLLMVIAYPVWAIPPMPGGDMYKSVYDTNNDGVVDSAASSTVATTITAADNQTDTTEFPVVVGAATGNLGPRTRSTFTYNAATGLLSSTLFGGALNGTVGATTPAAGAFTTLAASSTVSGAGFTAYMASPPAIGGTAPAAGTFTTVTANIYSTVRGDWPGYNMYYEPTSAGDSYWKDKTDDNMSGTVVNIWPRDTGAVGQHQVIVSLTGDNQTNSYAYSPTIRITQNTHGLAVGDVVKRSGSAYAKAQADSAANAEVVGIVSAAPTANTFDLTSHGYVTGLTGLTDGVVYYLSPSSAGALTSTQPSTAGQIVKPVLIATATTAGYFYNMRGTSVAVTTIVERLGVTFDGGGSAIADNSTAFVHVPFAATINQWTVICKEDSGTTGMIVDMYKDAYAADTLPTTTMCSSGSPPHTTDGAGAGGLVHQAAWDCNVATITADDIIKFKVTTPPSDATWCTVTLKVTR